MMVQGKGGVNNRSHRSYMTEIHLENPHVQAAIQERIAVVRDYKLLSGGDSFPLDWDLDDLAPNGLKYIIGPSDAFMKECSSSYNYVRRKQPAEAPE